MFRKCCGAVVRASDADRGTIVAQRGRGKMVLSIITAI